MADFYVTFNLDEQTPVNADFSLGEPQSIEANFSIDVKNGDHNLLFNRDLADQHPIKAITGLQEALDTIPTDHVSDVELEAALLEKQDVIHDLSEIRQGATLGATAVQPGQLESYATKDYVDEELLGKQDTLTAGANIQIVGNIISATDTTYTAGTGISIENGVISNTQTRAEWGNIQGDISAQTDLQNALNAKANVADIPTKTSDLTNDSGFITLSALTPYATQTWVSQQGYLTEIPVEYVTDSELTAKGYQTAEQVETSITSKGYTTMSAVEEKGYITSAALVGYATESYVTTEVGTETTARQNADNNLQSQIDAITSSSDVTDIVGTYAELQSYDTSELAPNSIIKVLKDESRNNETTYYRWVITGGIGAWSLIGEEGPYYTISAADAKFATQTALSTGLNGKQDTISDLATIRSGAALGATAVQPSDLATVATSGNYDDLSNKPTIPAAQVNADWNATSGVARILNKPTIPTVPTNVSAFTNDAGYITNSALNGYATQVWVGQQGYITGITSSDITTALGYTPVNPTSLSNVATSGDYDDLTNKPTIPTVNDAILTIQKNGTNIATFTSNSSTDTTANITVPTDTSDLTNGAGYITGITSGDVTTALGYTPYNSSNPSGYQTASDADSKYATKTELNTTVKLTGNQNISGTKTFKGTVQVPKVTKNSDKSSLLAASIGWVNDPNYALNVVHRDGSEAITGNKTFSINPQVTINTISATSGTVSLEVNKIYTMSVSGTTTFSLPTPSNKGVFNQIKVMAKVTGTPTINWGTTQFFNKTTPEIEAGNYDIYFDYDNLLNAWVCGVMSKGVAE